MKRRESLKLIAAGAVALPAALSGCKQGEKKKPEPEFSFDRNPDELKYEKELLAREKFFTEHEMETIAVLADIIIPRDEVSGSASEAGVPEFIEFIVKDMPSHQVPLRGGLRWLDVTCLKRFERAFKNCDPQQQTEIVDEIAYPEKAKAEMKPGVAFFTLLRNLVATGFYTSEIGVADLGYMGNVPNQWNGVPPEVLSQYKLAYSDKDLKDCLSFPTTPGA
ncbi:MAG TPA: gluconate 2-dehydrogenase subunit 3 family protein [Chitinophagaceae bacterium]|nr:gluconate 2-dehydrogenase subunit 3 family protein [Chitinophagaceae bacterium]